MIRKLIKNGEYLPKKEKEQKSTAQFSLFDFNETFVNELDITADSQVSLFTDFGVSQQIIDEALCSGANEKDSRLTICAYFRRDFGLDDNVQFLKEHYEQGAFGFIFEGEQVSVYYDDKGIKVSKGNYANRSGATLVTWEQAAKRISELLDVGRYMPQSELDKVDDFEISFVADRLVEFARDMQEEYTNRDNILPFVKHHIKNIGGYPDRVEKVKELLNTPAYFNVIADEYADFMQALEDDGYFLRSNYGKKYTPEYVNLFVESMLREPIPFKAQPDFTTPSEYFISEDEIKAIIRGYESKRGSEDRLERYSYYLEHSNAKERVKHLKSHTGASSLSGFNYYENDSKGFTFSHNDLFRPYAKTTVSWQQVDKYIGNMIANHEYLSQDDLKLVDYYERKQAALAIHHFYFGVPVNIPKLNEYEYDEYWESVENIAEQLKSPVRVSEIQSIMTELYNSVDFEDRYRDYADIGIKTINEFADGTFTCFGDKNKTIAPLIKAEKTAESKFEKVNDDNTSPEWLKTYNGLKSKYPNTLAFYQVGDFFETYSDDAKVVAKHLDLVLTSRHINDTERVVMCGFPNRDLDKNAKRLNEFGFSVVLSAMENGERKEQIYPYPPLADDYRLKQAKDLIDNFVNKEYEHSNGADFSDLTNVNVAYTNLGDNEEHEVQAAVDLVNFAVNKYYDGKLAESSQYKSLDDLINYELEGLSFDDLVYIDEDKISELEKAPVTIEQALQYIKNFNEISTEYTDESQYADLSDIALAYTTTEDNLHEIQVTANLIDFTINQFIDDKLVYTEQYNSLDDMTEKALKWLDFDNLVSVSDESELKFKELSENKTELDTSEFASKNNNSISSNSTIRRNYNLLNEICPEIFSKEQDYVKFESGSLMPLTIEWISDDRIAVVHYYKVNGDMVADPDMEFIVDVENRTLTAATYQQDNLALYQNVYAYETPNYNLQKDLNQFANQWFKNIKSQNYERVYDDLEIKSDNESNSISTSQSKSRVQTFDLHPEIPMADRHNYNFRDKEIETVGKKERFRRNINAINVLRECEFDNRFATPEEQEILSGYVGWGGLSEAFDENNSAWADEFIELYTVLSPDEYDAARASTLTAFYTPQPVISAIYKALDNLGFKQGNILEPCCAIGNFIGMLPENMQDSKMFGVEMDTVSAGIAQQLYPKSSIMVTPFEKADIPDSFFDAVVGNVPFGNYKLNDKRYDKNNFLIHDYFFAKSLDKLRPGGVMCLITSKGTMDKESSDVRRYLAQRADLLGAIRLPDNTFKGNADAKVTSDILILQKRDRMADVEPEWVQLDTDENGIRMNKYFVNHPEMILGDMVMESGRFKPESACKAFENSDLSKLLEKAVSNIKGEITEYSIDDIADDDEEYIPADPNVRNFSYTVCDGKIYYRENSLMREVKAGITAENRIKGMIAIRDSVRKLLEMQSENYPDDEIKAEQANLNVVYDSFVDKYGYINSRANESAFAEDSSYFLICSLEIFKEGKFERKADMFNKRTIQSHNPKTHADNSIEAFGISMGEKACVDMEYMCQLTGKSEDEIFSDLMDIIYLNPDYSENGNAPKYLTSDEYLSGNVRVKLRQAKDLAEKDERFKINVQALEKVQPVDLKPNDISVHLGVTWIPIKYIEQFMYELLDTPYHIKSKIRVHYNEVADSWNIEHKSADNINLNVTQKYGTDRKNAFHIIENTLNLRNVKVFDYEENDEGKRVAILNKDETTIAQQKQKIIKQKFKDWIWRDPERRDTLCKLYNEKFNCIRPREYDGNHIVFEGMNPEITLRPNQRNAVARGIYGGNSLFAHCVGAGKTYTMAAIAQESKRLGLCTKSLFVVPNHIVPQWASEYLTLYPSANILVATKKDFETRNRKKFCARIATGDYDAIIIGHSQFEKIPLSVGRQVFNINKQIQEIMQGIEDVKAENGERFTVKALEQTKKRLETKLKRLNDQSRKDDVVTFEELGVDRIFVDEAHYYKNLFIYSKMRNVAGISQTEAQKSSDLFMKCQYLDELTDCKGVMFATGTPISNSMVELYTMQRYLQYETLRKFGYLNFDSWAAQYGETVTAMELAPEGTGYRMKTRFAKFNNLPELMSIFRMCADIQTADMLKLPVPKAVYKNISVKPSEIQREMVSDLADRADAIRERLVKPYEDNMLKITNDGRKLALDQRLMNPALPDFEGSKVNECIRNIYDIWENTAEKKSTQLVFCDLSTPSANTTKTDNVDLAKMLVFQNIYDDIRTKLIEKGVPPEEIAFIHDAKNDKQKADLFAKVRSGKVRVLLGSTQKMGAGTNVQNKLIAIHHIDCPWRPSDLQQREGRIVRQGNENDEVYIFSYVTENTFDAYLYQLVENKQKFIGQVMTSKTPMRSIEDIDEAALSYAEIKMLATGNPLIKEKMDLDKQVEDLKLLERNYYSERYDFEDKVTKEYPQQITLCKSKIKALEIDIETAKRHLKSSSDYFGGMVINGETYSEKKAAGEAIIRIMKTFKHSLQTLPVGTYRGFEMDMTLAAGLRGAEYILLIKGAMTHKLELGYDVYGNITRIDNCIDNFESDLHIVKFSLSETQKQLEIAQESLKEPFEQADELAQKEERLNELNEILCLDEDDGFIDEEPDENEIKQPKREKVLVR
ncbi:MAG: DEAD/DEAH box helicase family protein [Acetobacter sp.]|nr:DEAD/DEAH box helicase family protein [Bacteroides sp.]MCM1341876.1 DEAD/DEAH box helicase family protein [Acetobacter sp.]MCM1433173.1 DEAD/DEAH box helicase family protein [Clostridiales bacterium]